MEAGSLGIGTSLVSRAGPALQVTGLTWEKNKAQELAAGTGSSFGGYTVYNLTVEDDHTFFVGSAGGGTWVHNTCVINPEIRSKIAEVLRRINRGDPHPYAQDGTEFRNRELRLPSQPSGYYHEYTIPTSGIATRGAQRIVTGKGGEIFSTLDHYTTFLHLNP